MRAAVLTPRSRGTNSRVDHRADGDRVLLGVVQD